jgi:hypothetical protein
VEAVQRRAAKYVANNHRNRSSVSNIIQRLKWRPLADQRKDARRVMLYKIDRELVAINKKNRLIPTGRKTRQSHNRSFQMIPDCTAYSTSGRASVKYVCSFILIDGIFRFLSIKPRVLFALLVI